MYFSDTKHLEKGLKSSKTCPTLLIIIDKFKKTVLENERVGIREIPKDLNNSYGSAQLNFGYCFVYEAG